MGNNLKTWSEVTGNNVCGGNVLNTNPYTPDRAIVEVRNKGILRKKRTVKVAGVEVVTAPKSVIDVASKGVAEGIAAAAAFVCVSAAMDLVGMGVSKAIKTVAIGGKSLSQKFPIKGHDAGVDDDEDFEDFED